MDLVQHSRRHFTNCSHFSCFEHPRSFHDTAPRLYLVLRSA